MSDKTFTFTLPHEERAEAITLACLISHGPDAAPDVLPRLAPSLFYDGTHRLIFDAFARLHADGQPCGVLDVSAALIKDGQRPAAGRAVELLNAETNTLPPSALAAEVDKLAAVAQKRELFAVSERLRAASLNGTAPADILAGTRDDLTRIEVAHGAEPPKPMVEFLPPSALRTFAPPEGWNMVGNYHIQRGSVFVVGGAPGVGKSRTATALAVAGATRANWFGLTVHRPFKTMILQAENGPVRLRDEFAELSDPNLDEFIRVCPPPPCGFALDHPEFRRQFAAAVEKFRPDVLMVDPWNRVTSDDKSKDYLAAFGQLQSLLPAGDAAPALGIIAHTRKPQTGERANGRALLNLLAGSYALGSVPRAVFILQHASDDPEENRVVFTCAKNNDGELGPRTAWERRNGLFAPVGNFDWQEFDAPPEKRRTITAADLEATFRDGKGKPCSLPKSEAVSRLEEFTNCSKSACYAALDTEKGKFASRLSLKGGQLSWK